ncbi:pyridoxal phosphate-dependent aminotransferase [Enhygromyxa salina]|uniref:Aminotransferase n=1 Tax=Enhygromyxa salina TaxID=215803 RepID=A0A2S9XL43_9BACT|nr:aminotransferase class I/II-fold pyridoxal phosphate-dependent enzyme [Enhygromyxa salina]PRP93604.1 putative N-acetyl-LL-diaminopimelate aminotransferase [Enhygromyxa salina]
MSGPDPRFADDAVNLEVLRERSFNLRWATLPADVIPLTAADIDFPVAQEIREAVKAWIDRGYFSYGPAEGLPEFRAAAATMLRTRKGLASASAAQVLATNSAAAALETAARFMLAPGDEAIISDPVDFLFQRSVQEAGGTAVRWACDPATGAVDFEQLARLITPRTRMIGLCNPLNPVGKVWTTPELEQLATIAEQHDLWILSDEIWSDIVYGDARHVSIASDHFGVGGRTVTVTGLSKTFGLAGLRIGLLHASDEAVVEGLLEASGARSTANGAATISQAAAVAAWEQGWDWAEGFLHHLHAQREFAVRRLREIPGVELRAPDGCYVLFPSIRQTGRSSEWIAEHLLEHHRVAVVPGAARWFGPGAEGHIRISFATSRAVLEEGLSRVAAGLQALA